MSLSQRMIIDSYEYELFELRKQIKELKDQLETERETGCIEGSYYDELMETHYMQLSCGHETSEYEPNYCPICGIRIKQKDGSL